MSARKIKKALGKKPITEKITEKNPASIRFVNSRRTTATQLITKPLRLNALLEKKQLYA